MGRNDAFSTTKLTTDACRKDAFFDKLVMCRAIDFEGLGFLLHDENEPEMGQWLH